MLRNYEIIISVPLLRGHSYRAAVCLSRARQHRHDVRCRLQCALYHDSYIFRFSSTKPAYYIFLILNLLRIDLIYLLMLIYSLRYKLRNEA